MVAVRGMPYPGDLTDDQWQMSEPVLNAPLLTQRHLGAGPDGVAVAVRQGTGRAEQTPR